MAIGEIQNIESPERDRTILIMGDGCEGEIHWELPCKDSESGETRRAYYIKPSQPFINKYPEIKNDPYFQRNGLVKFSTLKDNVVELSSDPDPKKLCLCDYKQRETNLHSIKLDSEFAKSIKELLIKLGSQEALIKNLKLENEKLKLQLKKFIETPLDEMAEEISEKVVNKSKDFWISLLGRGIIKPNE